MADSMLWLALMIGNSRLHWAWLKGKSSIWAWDTDHLPPKVIRQLFNCKTLEDFITHFPHSLTPSLPHSLTPSLLLASVVPSQTELWLSYPNVRVITLDQIPLQGLYPKLGIDRALALLGAGENWGFPMLVIDAGTALTFTGADANRRLIGGAILPGLGLQLATLAQKTGQLPMVGLQEQLPQRFALKTEEAIQSGVIYTLVAGIKDFIEAWWREYPESKIVMTGGDRTLLIKYMQVLFPDLSVHLYVEKNLIFWGMQAIIFNR